MLFAGFIQLYDLFSEVYARNEEDKGKGKLGKRKENKTIYGFLSYQQLIVCKKSLVLNHISILDAYDLP